MGGTSSGSKWQQPPSTQTEVLTDPNMVLKILRKGASTELRLAHRIFMMELCDVRWSCAIAMARDEMWACLRQAMGQLFGAGQHREATEILVVHIMLVNPGADKEKMLKGRQFDDSGELVDWDLSRCKISQLPESFCALVCRRDLMLYGNRLRSLPEGFGSITVGRDLYLNDNQLQSFKYKSLSNQLPEGFGDITVGRDLFLNHNQLQSLPKGFGNITVGRDLFLNDNQLQSLPEGFGSITVGGYLILHDNQLQSLLLSAKQLRGGEKQLIEYPSSFPIVRESIYR